MDNNWTGAYTKPSPSLYPHQWNWDSGFIAIGYSSYNQKRAQQEVISLLNNQWDNGMLPQIVFNPKVLGHYFPEPDFWEVPDGRLTSGITMPPLVTIACLYIYKNAKDKKSCRDFLKHIYPKLLSTHRYLYRFRDPEKSGLVSIRHPWESGLDNSPAWDQPLKNIKINKEQLPHYKRKDLGHGVKAEYRPTDHDYDRYVFLVDLFKRLKYREEDIYQESPFMIKDILFNSILCRANQDLLEIARIANNDTSEVEEWSKQTSKAISQGLWCTECQRFESFDVPNRELLHAGTAANFMPLFGGAASEEQAGILYKTMDSVSFCALHQGNCFTIPNYDMMSEDFDPKNYWRGPVWININWMLSQGLQRYGYRVKADAMKKDILQLPIRFGFHEYFDSQTGQGYGSPNFSWTAALFIQLIHEYYEKDRHSLSWFRTTKTRKLKNMVLLNPVTDSLPHPSIDIASDLMKGIVELKKRYFNIDKGIIDYDAIKNSPEYKNYQSITTRLHSFDLMDLSSLEQRLAFWINLYNVIVVHGIMETDIRASVREIDNFFSKISYRISGHVFSPDDIEHGILRCNARPPYKPFSVFKKDDPRLKFSLEKLIPQIHFALVCGSRSCAPIGFYEEESISDQLELATRNFINSSEVVIVEEEDKIFLSQIFNWYKKDFGTKREILQFIMKYLEQDKKAEYLKEHMDTIKVEYLFYDWNLNH